MRPKYTLAEDRSAPAVDLKTCEVCGKQFLTYEHTQKRCSRECFRVWWRANVQKRLHAQTKGRWEDYRQQKKKSEIDPEEGSDDEVWRLRSEYWIKRSAPSTSRRKPQLRKRQERKSLVLTGHGVRLSVEHGTLLVRNGLTHYPQEREEFRFFPGDSQMPTRIVLLDTTGSISLSVINWLSEQNVPLVLINWRGEVVTAFSHNAAAYDPVLRGAQLDAQTNGLGVELTRHLIGEKIANSKLTLQSLPESAISERSIGKLDYHLERLKAAPSNVRSMMVIEAHAAVAYFSAWQKLPLKWMKLGKRPIPLEWRYIGQRDSHVSGLNKHATHPVNAMLNYAYALLESQVTISTAEHGLDVSIGYLHSQFKRQNSLVFDLMEPLRPIVDLSVIRSALSQSVSPKDFLLTKEGVCRLNPQLTSRVVELTYGNASLQEAIAKTITISKGHLASGLSPHDPNDKNGILVGKTTGGKVLGGDHRPSGRRRRPKVPAV